MQKGRVLLWVLIILYVISLYISLEYFGTFSLGRVVISTIGSIITIIIFTIYILKPEVMAIKSMSSKGLIAFRIFCIFSLALIIYGMINQWTNYFRWIGL
jgi:hypothetical protein